jgi:hydrogenase expression/formation protein HypE
VKGEAILLDHGGGGRLSRELIEAEILPRFGRGPLAGLPDGASLTSRTRRLVFTTDAYVVQPPEFPGGNIGHLAVHGTVNDLAVCGARPRWLSLAMILEEGLPLALLRRVLDGVQAAAADCGVAVVTGDTKVVPRGACDRLALCTAGIGEALPGFRLGPPRIRPGDAILVNGPLGDHGVAVMAAREGIGIAGAPRSDTGPVHRLVAALGELAGQAAFLRDPTRGGLAAVLNEAARAARREVRLDEAAVPFSAGARAVAGLLGLDLFSVASEGRLALFCRAGAADAILARWRRLPEGRGAARIGEVARGRTGRVVLATVAGGERILDVPEGELLPRIC